MIILKNGGGFIFTERGQKVEEGKIGVFGDFEVGN